MCIIVFIFMPYHRSCSVFRSRTFFEPFNCLSPLIRRAFVLFLGQVSVNRRSHFTKAIRFIIRFLRPFSKCCLKLLKSFIKASSSYISIISAQSFKQAHNFSKNWRIINALNDSSVHFYLTHRLLPNFFEKIQKNTSYEFFHLLFVIFLSLLLKQKYFYKPSQS